MICHHVGNVTDGTTAPDVQLLDHLEAEGDEEGAVDHVAVGEQVELVHGVVSVVVGHESVRVTETLDVALDQAI